MMHCCIRVASASGVTVPYFMKAAATTARNRKPDAATTPSGRTTPSSQPSSPTSPTAAPSGGPRPRWSNAGVWLDVSVLVAIAAAARLWQLHVPNSVVFDEYHFGKFINW